jgi:hypothetical protein
VIQLLAVSNRMECPGGGDAEADGEVGLADAGRAEQDHVLGSRNERAGGQVGQDVAAQRGQAQAGYRDLVLGARWTEVVPWRRRMSSR